MKTFIRLVIILGLVAVPKWAGLAASPPVTLLNVSYDPTRELYQDYNAAFARHWKEAKGKDVIINQSHGGSVKQTRAVIDGEEALSRRIGSLVCRTAAHPTPQRLFSSCGKEIQKGFTTGQISSNKAFR